MDAGDAYLSQAASAAPKLAPVDPDAYLANAAQSAATATASEKHQPGSVWGSVAGGAEGLLHAASKQVGQVVGGLAGLGSIPLHAVGLNYDPAGQVKAWQEALTYDPRTQEGKEVVEGAGNAISSGIQKGLGLAEKGGNAVVPGLGTAITNPGDTWYKGGQQIESVLPNSFKGSIAPAMGAIGSAMPTAMGIAAGRAFQGGRSSAPARTLDADSLPADTSQYAPGGSAASTLQGQLSTSSDEIAANIKQQIAQAQLKYGMDWKSHVDFDALNRHLEADSLPVPGRISAEQASQDPTALSNFYNKRATDPRIPDFLQWQNKNLSDNLAALRDKVGPDVSTTDMASHGDTLISAYQNIDAPKVAAIRDAYKAVEDANGGAFPVDAGKLLENVNGSLSKQLLSKQDPGGQLSELTDLARRGGMTMENYLSMRKNLGDVARTSADPAARTAASAMIDEMENLPLPEGASQQVKQLAGNARTLARQRFQELDADPAYKTAISGTMAPEDFVRKFVINGKSNTLPKMAENLSGDDVARQTMGTAVIDHLRDAARLDPTYSGNFASDSFARQVRRFDPLADTIFQNGEGETLRALSNYAKNTTAQPKGAFVNNSNTFVSQLGNAATGAAEGAANVAAHGIPVGTWIRKGLQNRAAAKSVEQSLKPGAGVVK